MKAIFLSIIDKKKKYILLIRRYDNTSSFPGGYIENNESKVEALKREIYEELNFDVEKYLDKIEEVKTSSDRIFLFILFMNIEDIIKIMKNSFNAKHFKSEILGVELLKLKKENIENILNQKENGNFKEQIMTLIKKYKLIN